MLTYGAIKPASLIGRLLYNNVSSLNTNTVVKTIQMFSPTDSLMLPSVDHTLSVWN